MTVGALLYALSVFLIEWEGGALFIDNNKNGRDTISLVWIRPGYSHPHCVSVVVTRLKRIALPFSQPISRACGAPIVFFTTIRLLFSASDEGQLPV